MILTPRDAEILRLVARYRFLRSLHLSSLLGGSRQQLLRRLQMLFHHGYLERPVSQIDYFLYGGSHAMVYGLGNRGAAYLHRTGALPAHRPDWSIRNYSIRRLFLDHALMVSDILVALEIACRTSTNVQFLNISDFPMPDIKAVKCNPRQWTVHTPTFGEVGVVPDAVFVLRPSGGKEILCFLEADRGTMPVASQDRQRSSLARKFAAYSATRRNGLFRDQFGYSRVRAITITTTPERLNSIAECLRATVGASALFTQAEFARVIEGASEFLASLIVEAPRDS
jgi:hypothetical protein